jgi:type IV pilus assembly protein PilA
MAHREASMVPVWSFAACVALAACGGAPAPAAPSTAVVGPSAPAASSPLAQPPSRPRRSASASLKKAWPFEDPKVVVYADVEGLMRTAVMTEVMKSVIGLAGLWATPPQVKCLDDAIANVKEIAIGFDEDASLVVLRMDPAASTWVGACFKGAMPEAKPITMRGAIEAWDAHGAGALTADGLLLGGPKALVERALRGTGSGASLATVTLGDGEYVAWTAKIFDNTSPMTGSLTATDARFRIGVEADVPDDELAQRVESALSPAAVKAMLPGTNVKPDEAAALARLTNGVSVKRDGRHLAGAFELREPPAQQARDLGMAAALGVYGLRRYIANAKAAEARNALGQIAKDVVTEWEGEWAPDNKPRANVKKKLVSYGPVPKTVPKGVKYQSSAADWKPWAPLRFEISAPQYYQYEIKAAKDGESAEIIARGDLNGDGKASLFKLSIKVDRTANALRVAPTIAETDPEE